MRGLADFLVTKLKVGIFGKKVEDPWSEAMNLYVPKQKTTIN